MIEEQVQTEMDEGQQALDKAIRELYSQGYAAGIIESQHMYSKMIEAAMVGLFHLEVKLTRYAPSSLEEFNINKAMYAQQLDQIIAQLKETTGEVVPGEDGSNLNIDLSQE